MRASALHVRLQAQTLESHPDPRRLVCPQLPGCPPSSMRGTIAEERCRIALFRCGTRAATTGLPTGRVMLHSAHASSTRRRFPVSVCTTTTGSEDEVESTGAEDDEDDEDEIRIRETAASYAAPSFPRGTRSKASCMLKEPSTARGRRSGKLIPIGIRRRHGVQVEIGRQVLPNNASSSELREDLVAASTADADSPSGAHEVAPTQRHVE